MPSPHPDHQPSAQAPRPKQLRYLRALANNRGQTFTYPRTKAQASAEIRRLDPTRRRPRGRRRGHRLRRQRPLDTQQHPGGAGMSTAGRAHELARYELPDGTTRALIAQRINGRVAISDVPTGDDGRVYLV